MRQPDHTVMFAVTNEEISNTPNREFESEQIEVEIQRSTENLIIGEYDFESDPSFGSPTEAQGYIVFDENVSLAAVTTRYDNPKARQVFEALGEALGTSFSTPDLEPEDQHQIYEKYGFDSINGYTVSFKENSKEFDYSSDMGRTLDPEDRAEERCKYSNERMSDDLVNDIAKEAMDDGMYIWTSDLHIEGQTVGYSDPIRFTRISDEFLEENGFEKLFDIAQEALN